MTKVAELVEQAFLAGYRHGVTTYSWWWKDEQLVGGANTRQRMSDALAKAPESCREAYMRFLQLQQRQHDGVEKPLTVVPKLAEAAGDGG